MHYDAYIMMSRTQITLEPELQRRARQRACDLGVSLAEYIRRLLVRDLGAPQATVDVKAVFDLGASGSSDVASNKAVMIAEAFSAQHRKPRRRLERPA